MDATNILDKLTKETIDHVARNRIKVNRFASKYNNAKRCFDTDDENDDLYQLFFDISQDFGISEDDVYFMFVQSKYTEDGKISKTFEEDFATKITLQETIKLQNND